MQRRRGVAGIAKSDSPMEGYLCASAFFFALLVHLRALCVAFAPLRFPLLPFSF